MFGTHGLGVTAGRGALAVAMVCAGACGGDDEANTEPLEVSVGANALEVEVGPAGAVLELEAGMRLTIPEGALEEPVQMRVRSMDLAGVAQPGARDGRRLEMPVVIEPHGLSLRREASIELRVLDDEVADADLRVLRLDDEDDDRFERLSVEVLQRDETSRGLDDTEVRRSGDDALLAERRVEVRVDRFSIFFVVEAPADVIAPSDDGGVPVEAGSEDGGGEGVDASTAMDAGVRVDGAAQMDAAVTTDGGLDSGTGEASTADAGDEDSGLDAGQTEPLQPSDFYRRIAAGSEVSAFIDDAGALWTFGRADQSRTGTGAPTSFAPVPLTSVESETFVHLVGGADFFVALTDDGDLYSWGYDGNGQQGNGTDPVQQIEEPVPHLVMGGVVTVDVEERRILALDDQGQIWRWGGNVHSPELIPAALPDGVTFVQLAEGFAHHLALDTTGQVWGWGTNGNDRLGGDNQPATLDDLTPVLMADDSTPFDNARFIAASQYTSFVIDEAGQLWSFGTNTYGTLGRGTASSGDGPPATIVATGTPGAFVRVHGFVDSVAAVDATGTAWAFGRNAGSRVIPVTPVDCSQMTCNRTATPFEGSASIDFVDVVLGDGHGLGVDTEGQLWSWGRNGHGQLGDGTRQDNSTPRATPGQVIMPDGRLPADLFLSHGSDQPRTTVVFDTGDAWTFGRGAVHSGASQEGVTPSRLAGLDGRHIVSHCGGICFTAVADDTGTVWTYGSGCNDGELGVLDGSMNPVSATTTWLEVSFPGDVAITQVACSNNTAYALDSDGFVWAWGDDFHGQLGTGAEVNDGGDHATTPVQVHGIDDQGVLGGVVSVDASHYSPSNEHAAALLSDGRVVIWGFNLYSNLGRPIPAPPADNCGSNCASFPLLICDPAVVDLTDCDDGSGPQFLTGIDEMSVGDNVIYARDGDVLYSWGDDYYGKLGRGTVEADDGHPAVMSAGSPPIPGSIVQIVAGGDFGLVLNDEGDVWTWGANHRGQLGKGDNSGSTCGTDPGICSQVPTKVDALDAVDIVAIEGGFDFAAALDAQGHVWTWGSSASGQLGHEQVVSVGGGHLGAQVPAQVRTLPR